MDQFHNIFWFLMGLSNHWLTHRKLDLWLSKLRHFRSTIRILQHTPCSSRVQILRIDISECTLKGIFFEWSQISSEFIDILKIFFKTFFPHDPETHLIWRRESKLRSYFVFLHSSYSFHNRLVVYYRVKKNYLMW